MTYINLTGECYSSEEDMVEFMGDGPDSPMAVRRRIERLRGAVNVKQASPPRAEKTTIDFRLGFPNNPLVVSPNRMGAIGNSSVVVTESGDIETFTLRLPPAPAEVWSVGNLKREVEGMIPDGTKEMVEVQVNPGTGQGEFEEWWPHLLFLSYIEMDSGEFINMIETVVSRYLEYMPQETERMRED